MTKAFDIRLAELQSKRDASVRCPLLQHLVRSQSRPAPPHWYSLAAARPPQKIKFDT